MEAPDSELQEVQIVCVVSAALLKVQCQMLLPILLHHEQCYNSTIGDLKKIYCHKFQSPIWEQKCIVPTLRYSLL